MQRLLHTPSALLVRRLLVLYGILQLCRALFYTYNHLTIGPIGWAEAGTLAGGSLRFDTRSILYADALFVLLCEVEPHGVGEVDDDDQHEIDDRVVPE